jgi:hypothetical protein
MKLRVCPTCAEITAGQIASAIKLHIPEGVRCTAELRELLGSCSSAFISLLSEEANAVCTAEDARTLTVTHVKEALSEQRLDLPAYAESLESVEEGATIRPKKKSRPSKSTPEEEAALAQKQAALFASARGGRPP